MNREETGETFHGIKVYRVELNDEEMSEVFESQPDLMEKEIIRYRTWDFETKLPEILAQRGLTKDDFIKMMGKDKLPLIVDRYSWELLRKDFNFKLVLYILNLKYILGINEYDLQVIHEFVNPHFKKK